MVVHKHTHTEPTQAAQAQHIKATLPKRQSVIQCLGTAMLQHLSCRGWMTPHMHAAQHFMLKTSRPQHHWLGT